MPSLEVSFVVECGEFSDTFDVLRRGETITEYGRTVIQPEQRFEALGTIYPTGDNSLVRQEDYQTGAKTLTICTKFRLRMSGEGWQPDLVLYRGTVFIVKKVNDWTPFGAGFVEAECSSVLSQDMPPQ